METKKVIIIGAAGRDFHNFNMLFRDNASYDVVAFTAAQIPFIANRRYPKELAGDRYPKGIGIHDESELERLIKKHEADVCVMSYSDLEYQDVMEKASLVNAAGADFWLVAPERTMLRSEKPVISICGVRTGVGKSQTTRYVAKLLREMGLRVGIVRHPMPYGVLKEQAAERFATLKDLDRYKTTIEEREEYELPVRLGFIVYSGVDYEKILRLAEKESDIIIWDGGNNDTSFFRSDLSIAVADPLRAGNELTYYPGETVARMAEVIVINKVNSATESEIGRVSTDMRGINPKAKIVLADSVVDVDNRGILKGKRVLLVEDGPTITHGGMRIGAATVAAEKFGVGSIVSAKRYAYGTIKDVYERYPRLDKELPAMGYSAKQIKDLEHTLMRADCDVVLSATPIDLKRLVNIDKPIVHVSYDLSPRGAVFDSIIRAFGKRYRSA
ncbi:MAG: GTPase [Candidatus Micrarchaeota archaeon]|nr:GTPase [Candidatus Micrarchaeota archaeon]MDE1851500.1 GTPase [Candidatus Micrarchaeota archaeon]